MTNFVTNVAIVAVSSLIIVLCVVAIVFTIRHGLKRRRRAFAAHLEGTNRSLSRGEHGVAPLVDSTGQNPFLLASQQRSESDAALARDGFGPMRVRVLPNGQVVRTVPVHAAEADVLQMWRVVNSADLAGEALRLSSGACQEERRSVSATHRSSDVPRGSPRGPATESPKDGEERAREQAREGSHVFPEDSRRPSCVVGAKGRGSDDDNDDEHGIEQASHDGTDAAGGSDEAWTPSTPSVTPTVWCPLGIPQSPSPFEELSLRLAASTEGNQDQRDDALDGAESAEREAREEEGNIRRDSHVQRSHLERTRASLSTQSLGTTSPTLPQEAMPWHPFRNNRRYLLLYRDGHSVLTSDLEPWADVAERHRQREARQSQHNTQQQQQQQQHLRLSQSSSETASTAVHVLPDALESSSSRSRMSLISRLFSRQSRHSESQSSQPRRAHSTVVAATSPPVLSPLAASVQGHASFTAAAATATETPQTQRRRPVEVPGENDAHGDYGRVPDSEEDAAEDAASPMNVVAQATVLVLEPLPSPPTPTRIALLPDASQIYGRGSIYTPCLETHPHPFAAEESMRDTDEHSLLLNNE